MLLDIGPPFSDLTGIAHIAVDPQPSWLTVAFAQASFQRFCWRAPRRRLYLPCGDGQSVAPSGPWRGFRHTSPTGRRAGQPSGLLRHRAGVDRRHPGIRTPGQEIPLWLQPPPDPQPSDRIAQIPAMATHPPASLLLLLFAAKYQLIVRFVPVNPAAHYPAAPRQKHIMRSWQLCRRRLCWRGAFVPIWEE